MVKSSLNRIISVLTALIMVCTLLPAVNVSAAEMVTASSSVSGVTSMVNRSDEAKVNLTMRGTAYSRAGAVEKNDIVLVIDRSGSMSGKYISMIDAARDFIRNIDFNSHRVGVVAYDSDTVRFSLSDDPDTINSYLDDLEETGVLGSTAMDKGIDEAVTLLATKRAGCVGAIVLMTDGEPDNEMSALQAAQIAKSKGYVFYTVALTSSETSAANERLKKMATSAADHYFVMNTTQLAPVYKKIAAKIGKVYAKDLVVTLDIPDGVSLVPTSTAGNTPLPTVYSNKLVWKLNQLGDDQPANFFFSVQPDVHSKATEVTLGTGTVEYVDYEGYHKTIILTGRKIKIVRPLLVIDKLSPGSALEQTETKVTILGQNFSDDCTVTVAGQEIPIDSVSPDGTEISLTIPGMDAGIYDVRVENNAGRFDTGRFTVRTKSEEFDVISLSPDSGPEYIDQVITVSGTGLADIYSITIGASNFTSSITDLSDDSFKFTLPGRAANSVTLSFKSINGKIVKKKFTFTPPVVSNGRVPKITGMDPDNGPAKTDQVITVSGENLSSLVDIYIGGTHFISSLTDLTDSSFKFTLPGRSTLPVTISFKFKDGTILKQKYSLGTKTTAPEDLPEITSISPDKGDEKTDQIITVSGKNLSGINDIYIGANHYTSSITDLTDDSFKFTLPGRSAVPVTISFKFDDGTILKQKFTFEVPPAPVIPTPEITGITPDKGNENTDQIITVSGRNLSSINDIYIGANHYTSSLTDVTDSSFKFTLPGRSAVAVTISFKFDDGTILKQKFTFEVPPAPVVPTPEITGITPDTVKAKTDQVITVSGKNLSGINDIYIGANHYTSSLTDVTDSSFKFTLPGRSSTVTISFKFNDGTILKQKVVIS